MRNYTGNGWQGSRYDRDLDITDIAKALRVELKEKYPECKFSVRIERYAGGQSLTIGLMAGPFRAVWRKGSFWQGKFIPTEKFQQSGQLNQHSFNRCHGFYEDKSLPMHGWNNGLQLSWRAWRIMWDAYLMARSYNYDDSDGMIDYFDTNFYLNLEIGRWDKPFETTCRIKPPVPRRTVGIKKET